MDEKIQTLVDLFVETGHAHHQAFIETDGADPEWPIWYAGYLADKLPPLLKASLTKSELVYLMVYLNTRQSAEAPGSKWPYYYARYFAQHYL